MRQQTQPTSAPKRPFKLNCSFRIEREFGFPFIAGIDEVGRGCIAGPVVAAGVVFDPQHRESTETPFKEINDSKLLKPEKREELDVFIRRRAIAVELAVVSHREIERINILRATFKAAREVIRKLEARLLKPLDLVLFDGPHRIPYISRKQHTIIMGDQISRSIAAASIVAKVYRDRLMQDLSTKYPGYSFETNKGYGTEEHWKAVDQMGPCTLHRRTFLKKMRSLQLGADGEALVVEFLEQNEFKILHRNWKTRGAEIDVIAERDDELHFIEVRARSLSLDLSLYFSSLKQNQFRKAVEIFFHRNPDLSSRQFRLSLVCVTPEGIEPFWDVFKF